MKEHPVFFTQEARKDLKAIGDYILEVSNQTSVAENYPRRLRRVTEARPEQVFAFQSLSKTAEAAYSRKAYSLYINRRTVALSLIAFCPGGSIWSRTADDIVGRLGR